MTALEAVQNVQFVTVKKKRFALIEAEEWESLVEWLERLEDLHLFKESYAELARAGGSREQAGWQRWEDVRDEIE
jgi:hypothetical protein